MITYSIYRRADQDQKKIHLGKVATFSRCMRKWSASTSVDGSREVRFRSCQPDLAKKFGEIIGIPVTFLVDRKGTVVKRYDGPREYDVFLKDIKELL